MKKGVLLPLISIFGAWVIGKGLDAYFDFTVLTSIWGWMVASWHWLEQEIPMPLWLLFGVSLSAISVMVMLVYIMVQLHHAEAEIARLKKPQTPALSDLQQRVLMMIAGFLDSDNFPCERDIRQQLGITSLPLQAALDVLENRRLIEDGMLDDGSSFIDLTPSGRIYVLQHAPTEQASDSASKPF